MHKLKNKHTGEVITTPYLAEVEEYLNSGDYEMKNEYPYIGKAPVSGYIVLFLAKDLAALIDGNHPHGVSNYVNYWVEPRFTNITREYLTNTYGKCESQEHADFICKLAENHGFELNKDYTFGDYFYICKTKFGFGDWQFCSDDDAKLISLPLPPKKESKMPEEKPVYTKEMHERGELPTVGMDLLIAFKGGNTFKGKIKYISTDGFVFEKENGKDSFNGSLDIVVFKPLPTIEDELAELLDEVNHVNKAEVVNKIIKLYNITPKEK